MGYNFGFKDRFIGESIELSLPGLNLFLITLNIQVLIHRN